MREITNKSVPEMALPAESRGGLVLYRPLRAVVVLVLKCGKLTLRFGFLNGNFASLDISRGTRMGDLSDRREARRFAMTLPVRVMVNDANGPELKASTRDVSYRGLYFLTEAPFEKGSEIDFVLTLPQQIISTGDVHIRCHGRVVRVQAENDGKTGIAAKIEKYEFIPARASAA